MTQKKKNVALTKLGLSVPKIAPETILWYAHVLRDATESFMIKNILCTNASSSSIFPPLPIHPLLFVNQHPAVTSSKTIGRLCWAAFATALCVGLQSRRSTTILPEIWCDSLHCEAKNYHRLFDFNHRHKNKRIAKLKPAAKYQWALRDKKE